MPVRFNRSNSHSKLIIPTIFVIVGILVILFIGSWVISRGVDNNPPDPGANSNASTQQLPANNRVEPTNPNVTGGSSGAGNGVSNDPAIGTPSPAGGVDTNQVPAGGSSPAQ